MHLTIREPLPDDAPAIAALSLQLGYSITAEKTAAQIIAISNSPNDVAYVAVDGHTVIGWIHVFRTLRLECDPYCEIGGLVVEQLYRGNGIGKILIDNARPWCREKKCSVLRVRSNVKRTDAHKFYEQVGFTTIKQQKVFEIPL